MFGQFIGIFYREYIFIVSIFLGDYISPIQSVLVLDQIVPLILVGNLYSYRYQGNGASYSLEELLIGLQFYTRRSLRKRKSFIEVIYLGACLAHPRYTEEDIEPSLEVADHKGRYSAPFRAKSVYNGVLYPRQAYFELETAEQGVERLKLQLDLNPPPLSYAQLKDILIAAAIE